jgi:hypothetical protein
MMYVWNQEGYSVASTGRPSDPQTDMVELFNQHGFTGVLGTNVKQEYVKEVGPGDTVYVEMVIDNISERKATARGSGYFFETLATFTDQNEDVIGTQRFRVLKFIPQEQPAAAASEDKLDVPTRIQSPRGHDNGWWWNAVDEGKVLIQRCKSCQTLRHPPDRCVANASPWSGIPSNRISTESLCPIRRCDIRKSPATPKIQSAPLSNSAKAPISCPTWWAANTLTCT